MRRYSEVMETTAAIPAYLFLVVNGDEVVREGTHGHLFVWMIPEITEVAQQFMAVFPEIEV